MARIKELPTLERPREKCLRYGPESLSDEELLAIIIGKGYRGKNAKDVAFDILSNSGGLLSFSNLSYRALTSFKGISRVKALTLCSLIELWKRLSLKTIEEQEIAEDEFLLKKYQIYLKDIKQEIIAIVCLDINKRIIHEEILYKGTSTSVGISLKDITRIVLDYNSKYFYIIHNHPSGLSSPSEEDILFTKKLIRKTRHLNIPMLDHLIISNKGYYSFKNNF